MASKASWFISIILPIYNIESYIEICMNSVLAQTYSNIEILMIDDGSTDSSPDICDKYGLLDKRIRVFHKKNGGLSDARNYGIAKAKGDYITCIDPDDYVDKDYIEYLVMLIEKYDSKMAICQHRIIFNNGKIKDLGQSGDEFMTARTCLERMLYHDVIDTSAWAKLYHKSIFSSVKYPKGKIFEDIGTTYALILQCKRIAVGYESRYNYVFHNNSIVNSDFKISKFDLIEMTNKMAKDVLLVYPDLRQAVLRRCVYAHLSTLNQMAETSKYEKKRKDIIDYIKQNRKDILFDRYAPKRDKAAIILLSINYNLYRNIWRKYRRFIMKE